MIANVPTEVVPVWFIEKWTKENAEYGSPLEYFVSEMLKQWKVEEFRTALKDKKQGGQK